MSQCLCQNVTMDALTSSQAQNYQLLEQQVCVCVYLCLCLSVCLSVYLCMCVCMCVYWLIYYVCAHCFIVFVHVFVYVCVYLLCFLYIPYSGKVWRIVWCRESLTNRWWCTKLKPSKLILTITNVLADLLIFQMLKKSKFAKLSYSSLCVLFR